MRKRWSILIVPNTSEQGYNIGVSAWALKLGALFLFVTFIAVVAFCAVRVDAWKRQHIRIVSDLEQEISARDSNLDVIEKEFSRLLSLEDKLRAIAGLKPRQTAAEGVGMGGQGGPELSETILYSKDRPGRSFFLLENRSLSADELLREIATVHEGFSEILDAFEREQERLSSIPSINPVYSPEAWISSGYGYRKDPITGNRRFHDGIDIVAPRKTPIIAPADGVVTYAGWRDGLGRMIEIRHGYGYRTTYGHNEKLMVKKGAWIKRGDPVALLGSSGRSTGPHLHYEIRINGKLTNPYKYLID
ncbi:MAG: M23 family metallopeptidase [Candidatus Abyssubacteria bacterium]|nr:M23 family metallopeptidase [Candidatus Abyssubacteria bacterium]